MPRVGHKPIVDRHTPTPTPSLSRQISSNGPLRRLSYVGSEQFVRPTSFHGSSQAPPPIEIPTSTARMGTPASRLSALEFMISLSEAASNMVRKVPGWTDIIVRACLEGMGEFDEDETELSGLENWLRVKKDLTFFFDSLFIPCIWINAGWFCSLLLIQVQLKRIPLLPLCMNILWIGLLVRWVGGLRCRPRSKYVQNVNGATGVDIYIFFYYIFSTFRQ